MDSITESQEESADTYINMDMESDRHINQNIYTDEENQSYVAFIKAYAPVLLHLVEQAPPPPREDIKNIIAEFQELTVDSVPDPDKTTVLRNWVDLQSDAIGELTPDDIDRIMEAAKIKKLVIHKSKHTESYSLQNKRTRRGDHCLITMDPVKRDERYVDFLDGGKQYKVRAIIEYYEHLKTNPREDWRTPLRNPITEEQERLLEDLVNWYEGKRCKRNTSRKNYAESPLSPSKLEQGTRKKRRRKIKSAKTLKTLKSMNALMDKKSAKSSNPKKK